MELQLETGLLAVAAGAGALALVLLAVALARLAALGRALRADHDGDVQAREQKHREMLSDLHAGLTRQGDRIAAATQDGGERLRGTLEQELRQGRETLQVMQLAVNHNLAQSREAMLTQLRELAEALQATLRSQARAEQELVQTTLRESTQALGTTLETLTRTVDGRLEAISGRVTERLDEGFKQTNETFANVMARLATIDEAQKKIDGLTSNVVSLQELLGDKRARGAFGEVQLEALVANILPPSAFEMQHTLPNGARADCVLRLPEPTGLVAVDSKFPLENYNRMFDPALPETERRDAQRLFKLDVRRHIDDIGDKYIIANHTSDGAVMFVPAEAVFAEIHAYHPELVEHALQRRVWIVSPTTMMAVLNTARAVIKDVETRRQVHIIKDELGKLGKEFARFDQRMKKLADHIRQAHQDAEDVQVTSEKISRRFAQIERVELEPAAERPPLAAVDGAKGREQA
jgi:DNA recombination protein RmuC